MQFDSWAAPADKLHFERKETSRPTRVLLETTFKNNRSSMKIWNDIKDVADADIHEFHQGNSLEAKLVMKFLHDTLFRKTWHTPRLALVSNTLHY